MTDEPEIDDVWAGERAAMVAEVAQQVAQTARWLGKSALSQSVMAAMAKVPRHRFVPAADRTKAYRNRPLPIGEGQTISQPYMVAVMTDLAAIAPGCRVLEIGTGCGYQVAMLAEVGAEVDTMEVLPTLAAAARDRLAALGYGRIAVHVGNGRAGWPANAPYQAILVTAASAEGIPAALIDQLAPYGRLVIPVADEAELPLWSDTPQTLVVATKRTDGRLSERRILPVAFVPLV